jgi:hypothetical protein
MQDLTQGLVYGIVAVLVLVVVIRRQMVLRPVGSARMLAIPAILLLFGLFSDRTLPGRLDSAAGIVLLVAGVLIGAVAGVARGFSQRLIWRDGVVYARGTGWTLALWVATVLLRVGMAALGAVLHAPEGTGEVVLFLAITIGVQNLMLIRRAGLPLLGARPSLMAAKD